MKRYLAKLFFGLGLCQAALGGPSLIYQNLNPVTATMTPPVVDALSFYNANIFQVDTAASLNTTNRSGILYELGSYYSPYMTKDTLNWTNAVSGFMQGTPGFYFDTATSTTVHNANNFLNQGIIEGIDVAAFPDLFFLIGTASIEIDPSYSQGIPSLIEVFATNIVNHGAMSVGSDGLINQVGKNVTNAYASLAAGFINTGSETNNPQDVSGLQGGVDGEDDISNAQYFVPSIGIYDLFWGATNPTPKLDLTTVNPPYDLPPVEIETRGFLIGEGFPINFDTAQFSSTAILYNIGTNYYYNMVFVNTNFSGQDVSATVGFGGGSLFLSTNSIFNAEEDIVQIAEPVKDVITGEIVTNAIYLIDDGAFLPKFTFFTNALTLSSYSRPSPFAITTETPPDWDFSSPGDYFYDPTLIYTPQEFANQFVAYQVAEYGAQVGRNPAQLDGSFASLLETNGFAFDFLEDITVNLPDPTNEPARIQLSAQNLNLSQTRMRAEGMVVLNATNLINDGTSAVDWGEANANLGATNGTLVLSNMFPVTFKRIRGDIYAYALNWQNVQTNNGPGTNAPVTNQWYYHVLVVDQNIIGSFPSTTRNLILTGKNSIVLHDNLNVIGQAVINTTNLTLNSTNFFTQGAADFTPATTPYLKNLLINTNGILGASNYLNIGVNINQEVTSPTKRKYIVNTITNLGAMMANSPVFDSAIFENDGTVTATGDGSVVIEANALGLGLLGLTNTTNFVQAGGSVTLSASTIKASNSVISAGTFIEGALTLDATEELTDFVSSTPTTNTNSVIINRWTVTGGFSLPIKPAAGDLYGTQIHTISTGFQEAIHVWAGTDMGATKAGFVNNEVIGRLVLDRQSSNSVLRFTAAGAANAMYVDYLELTNFAYSEYRNGLIIDPNFTIYFAGCNADPEKLMEVYPGLKWVQNFSGPNSTVVVPFLNSSNICLMNTNLAFSFEISFFNSVPNVDNQPYVLNDPSNPNNTYPCPGEETTDRSLLVSTPRPGGNPSLNLLNITVNGEGSITPELKTSQLNNSYTLTAKPAKGWVFQNWSTIGLGGNVNANSAILPFKFVTNTLITANFIPNPFGAVQVVYNGLFFVRGAVNPDSSGSFTLTMQPSGSFSGDLVMGPSRYTFSSQFSGAGVAQVLAKSGQQSLTLNLQLDMTGQSGQLTGGVSGVAWYASLLANIAPVWTAQNPSPLAGKYTMSLPWASGGDSYGAGSINSQGVLILAGSLADGATFSASAPVSQQGQWPFYAYVPAGKDSVLGWVSVGNGLAGTNITWSKAAGKGPLYAAGFTNVLELTGSPWLSPARNSSALTLTNPTVSLSNGGLAEPLTIDVTLKNYLTYTATNLSLSINSATGSFNGWFDNSGNGQKQTIAGVVLQNAASASGFFLGTNESGAVLLQGSP